MWYEKWWEKILNLLQNPEKNINNSNYCHRIIIILVDKYDLPVGDQVIILKRLLKHTARKLMFQSNEISKCSNYFV
jgi:hypothetical protein